MNIFQKKKKLFYEKFFKPLQQSVTLNQTPNLRNAPTPPVIHNYFTTDYEMGAGYLHQGNNWKGNAFNRGFLGFDSDTKGMYLNIHEDQDSDVPYQLMTNLIATPNANTPVNGQSTDYVYLSPGRCWHLGDTAYILDIPLTIPPDAQYNGTVTIDGKSVQMWTFESVEYGYEGEARIGVTAISAEHDYAVVFVNVYQPYESPPTGIYFKFRNFDPSKPKPSIYAAPPPPCVPLV